MHERAPGSSPSRLRYVRYIHSIEKGLSVHFGLGKKNVVVLTGHFFLFKRISTVKKAIDELGLISAPSEWDPSRWNLTDLIGRILQHNGAPFFDLVVQVDDRNTSRYVLSVALPRQSGIMPQFHSPIARDLLHVLNSRPSSAPIHHRSKRQFVSVGDSPIDTREELPNSFFPEPLSQPDPSLDLYLPDSNFLQSVQVNTSTHKKRPR